jgi:hypothetical protein
MISPIDSCIDALVIRGAIQMAQFLSGESVPSIAWLEQKQDEKELYMPGHSIRKMVAPLAVSGVAFVRFSGLGSLYDCFEQICALANIISPPSQSQCVDYIDAERVFGGRPVIYVMGIIYASCVALARRFHLLL